jgi:hypothetical protein
MQGCGKIVKSVWKICRKTRKEASKKLAVASPAGNNGELFTHEDANNIFGTTARAREQEDAPLIYSRNGAVVAASEWDRGSCGAVSVA